jgi:hypothetical protein
VHGPRAPVRRGCIAVRSPCISVRNPCTADARRAQHRAPVAHDGARASRNFFRPFTAMQRRCTAVHGRLRDGARPARTRAPPAHNVRDARRKLHVPSPCGARRLHHCTPPSRHGARASLKFRRPCTAMQRRCTVVQERCSVAHDRITTMHMDRAECSTARIAARATSGGAAGFSPSTSLYRLAEARRFTGPLPRDVHPRCTAVRRPCTTMHWDDSRPQERRLSLARRPLSRD